MNNTYKASYGNFVGSQKGYNGFRNRLRIKKFTKIIKPQINDSILEIGCNTGLLTNNLSKFCNNVVGTDVNKQLVNKLDQNNVLEMSATDLLFSDSYFDKVCAFEVIEHIKDIGKVFSEVSRILKPEGLFIISFPFEFIRGEQALLDAIMVYHNPIHARRLHIHKLKPRLIKKIIKNLPLRIVKQKFILIPFVSYLMILQKK